MDFIDFAPIRLGVIAGDLIMNPKQFSTGSIGYYCYKNIEFLLYGQNRSWRLDIISTVIGSKDFSDDDKKIFLSAARSFAVKDHFDSAVIRPTMFKNKQGYYGDYRTKIILDERQYNLYVSAKLKST